MRFGSAPEVGLKSGSPSRSGKVPWRTRRTRRTHRGSAGWPLREEAQADSTAAGAVVRYEERKSRITTIAQREKENDAK